MNNYDVFLFDLWGVIVEGEYTYPGVVDVINSILPNKQVYFVSNAPRPAVKSFEIIRSWGVNASLQNVMTSGEVARRLIIDKLLCQSSKLSVFHLGADRNTDILSGINLDTTDNILKANILLLTLYRDYWEDLNAFDDLFKQVSGLDILTICVNPDTIIKYRDNFRYNAGYFANKLENFGHKVIYTGKPHLEIYELVFSKLKNVPKDRILMVGDTIETDILGAHNAGIHSALVLTGNTERLHSHLETIDSKIKELHKIALSSGVSPNFVISLT